MDLQRKKISPVHSWASCLVDQRHFSCPEAFAPDLLLGWRGLDLVVGWCNRICKWFVMRFVICWTHRALCRHTSLLWLTFVYDGRIFVFVHVPGHGHVFGLYLYHLIFRLSLWSRPKDSLTRIICHGEQKYFVPRTLRVTQYQPIAILCSMLVSDTYVGSAPSH